MPTFTRRHSFALGLASLAFAARPVRAQPGTEVTISAALRMNTAIDLELRAGNGPTARLRGENRSSRYDPVRITTTLTIPARADRLSLKGRARLSDTDLMPIDTTIPFIDATPCMQHLRTETADFGADVARFATAWNELPIATRHNRLELQRPATQSAIEAAIRHTGIALPAECRSLLQRSDGLRLGGLRGFLPAADLQRTDLWLRQARRKLWPTAVQRRAGRSGSAVGRSVPAA